MAWLMKAEASSYRGLCVAMEHRGWALLLGSHSAYAVIRTGIAIGYQIGRYDRAYRDTDTSLYKLGVGNRICIS
jgi:hypothetical protein